MAQGNPIVLSVRPFWTLGPWYDPITIGIRWFSRRKGTLKLAEVSHMGLEFELLERRVLTTADDNRASTTGRWRETHESLVGTDGWRCHPSRLVQRAERGYAVTFGAWLYDDRMALADMYQESIRWAAFRRPYDKRGIMRLMVAKSLFGRWLANRGRRVVGENDDRQVFCSEGACNILWLYSRNPEYWLDLRDSPLQRWADVTPQSALDKARTIGLA